MRKHRLFREALSATLGVVLIGTPAMTVPTSSPLAPLGVVVATENANVGAGVTTSGATIYDGDRLQTPANSTLQVRLGSGQMVLRQNTIADVHSFPNGFSANLGAGTVIVSSMEGQTFQVIADGATVRPANAHPTSGQISMISSTELILTSTSGMLVVTMGDEVETVGAGSSYRLEVEPPDPRPDPQPGRVHAAARSRFLWTMIPAISAATVVVIWRAVVSPSSPSN